jgi:type VI secretion system protein
MRRIAILALAALVLSGCGAARTIGLEEVSIKAAPDANGNGAVAVDVVLGTRTGSIEQVAKLPAAEWFRRRTQLLRDNPDGLAVMSWELIPGQSVTAPVRKVALDAYVFALYASPGDHRVRLATEDGEARILLQATGFVVEGLKKAE